MDTQEEYIPVAVDKSHIISIGKRFYTKVIRFVRGIVNNSDGVDALLVEITI